MRNLFIVLFLFSCSAEKLTFVKSISAQVTQIANVDSVSAILDSLKDVRFALPDPSTSVAKNIYVEELFKFTMIDSLTPIYPILQGKTDTAKVALLNAESGRFVHPDSTDDRGIPTRGRILTWLQLELPERSNRINSARFDGKVYYSSRDQLISVQEQATYAMFDGRPLRQVNKKMAIGRWTEKQQIKFTAFGFPDTTTFDSTLTALRSQYFESEIK